MWILLTNGAMFQDKQAIAVELIDGQVVFRDKKSKLTTVVNHHNFIVASVDSESVKKA